MNKKFFGLLILAGLSFSAQASEVIAEETYINPAPVAIDGCCQPMPAPRCCPEKRNCCPAPKPIAVRAPRAKCCPVPRQRRCVQRTVCCPRPVRSCPKIQRCMPRNKPECVPAKPCDAGCTSFVDMTPVQSCEVQAPAPCALQPVSMAPVVAPCDQTVRPVQAAPVRQVRQGRRPFARANRNVQPVVAAPNQTTAPVYTRRAPVANYTSRSTMQPVVQDVQPETPTNPLEIQPMTYASSQATQSYMNRNAQPEALEMEDITLDFKE